MSEIKGVRPAGAPRTLERDQLAATGVEGPTAAEPAGADPLVALFDAVQARFAGGVAPTDRARAVRAVVDEVLGREMGHLAEPTRAGVAEQVTAALLAHPDLSARLDRLFQRP